MVHNDVKVDNLKLQQRLTLKYSLLEIGPLAGVIISLWIKLIYFNMFLRFAGWASEQSADPWFQTYAYVFSTTLASLMFLFGLFPLLPRFWRAILLLVFNFFVTCLIVANLVHVHYYGDVLSISSLANARFLPRVFSSVIELLDLWHAIFYLDIIIGTVLLPLYLRIHRRTPPLGRGAKICQCAGLLACSLLLVVPTVRFVSQDQNGLFSTINIQYETVSVIGLLPYQFADAVEHLSSREQDVSQAELQRIRSFLKERGETESALFGVAQGKNVILISAESLQTFVIGLEIKGQPVTPRLSAFIKESLYFPNFHDQTYLGTTADGEFTVLQSLHPLSKGVVASNYARNHYHALPAILVEHNYTTLSACAAPPSFWNMDKMHARYGFQHSVFEEDYELQELINAWLADREFYTQTMPILKAQKEPFMAFLLSSSNHYPFDLPEKYRVLELGELEGDPLGKYLHSVHYLDQALGEFLDQLRETGLLDKSIVVIYGDHQSIGEASGLASILGVPPLNKYQKILNRKKVPLIIRLPHGEHAGVQQVTGGHLDVAPTILSLLGIPNDSVMLGRDLTQAGDSLVVFRDGSFTDGKSYFINHFGPISNAICYKVGTGQTIDCSPFKEQRRQASERLQISDLIIQHDLIPSLKPEGDKAVSQ